MEEAKSGTNVFLFMCIVCLTMHHPSFASYEGQSADPKKAVVGQIIISGNKVTKQRVILNELVFSYGDTIMVNKIGEAIKNSRNNLLNTSLFNFVSITYAKRDNNELIFHVKVDERWYWWAFPIFEYADRNFSSFLESKDWSRVNYGVYLKRDNFRGRKERLKMRVRVGYATQVSLLFDSPEYRRKTGWGVEFNVVAKNQLSYRTIDNRPEFILFDEGMAQYQYNSGIYYAYRSDFYQRHNLKLSHFAYNVNDSVIGLNPNYLTEGDSELQFLTLGYSYNYDRRDSKAYPLKGRKVTLELQKHGLGVLTNKLDDLSFGVQVQEYIELSRLFHYGATFEGVASTSDHLPYILKSGIGYDSFINGYELYVIDGTKRALLQNRMLFTLLEPRVKNIGFMPLSQFAKIHYAFYLKAYFDMGYAWLDSPDVSNTLANDLQYGYGLGIDMVTFYDKVVSFNYSFNKLGQHGFFMHINLDF
ncbi:POTRA domain-containing protein [Carboxylicivirga sp. N1Y90]|uniref:POTRA domain-containing protein n=1 Tax=Carboxylicivirga fragile TaxID=3417571 RepID=UPI003D3302F5|nr:hypothetical protein [Marinilabiliaceae bacterium N1Y90]